MSTNCRSLIFASPPISSRWSYLVLSGTSISLYKDIPCHTILSAPTALGSHLLNSMKLNKNI